MPQNFDWPGVRWLRLKQILAPEGPLPIARSTFYAWIASGKLPKPYKLGPRISVWPADLIFSLVESMSASTSHAHSPASAAAPATSEAERAAPEQGPKRQDRRSNTRTVK
jgi:predicted DNA-binding transcriptional regulator AlpA